MPFPSIDIREVMIRSNPPKSLLIDRRRTRALTGAVAVSVALALSACSSDDDDAEDNGTTDPGEQVPAAGTVSVSLSPASEVPPVTAPGASGSGSMSVASDGAVTASIEVSGLSGPARMAHIHRGFAGANGPVLIGLVSDDDGASWTVPADARVLTADEIGAFERGELYFNVHTDANGGGEVRGQIDPGNATAFTVRITNVSTPQTLPTSGDAQAVPLSPGAFVVHREATDSPLLLPRDVANAGLEGVAEDGNPSAYPDTVAGATVFNTPVGADAPAPIGPGGAYEFTLQALPGDKLGFVTMFVPSNDWFYTPTDADNSISLFGDDGTPVDGDVSDQIALWDAGSEQDEAPGEGPNQVQRQAAANTGPAEGAPVGSLSSMGKSVELNGSVIQVTITAQ